jgi:hypothetical protein
MFQLIMQVIHFLNNNLDFFYNSKLIKIKNLNKYRVLKLDVNYIIKLMIAFAIANHPINNLLLFLFAYLLGFLCT